MKHETIEAREVYSERYMRENDISPTATARIPRCETCHHMPWDCECPSVCEDCGETIRGPGLCGDCHGGR